MAEEEIEIILRAIDEASDTFSSVSESVEQASASVEAMASVADSIDGASFQDAAGAADGLESEVDEAAEAMENLNNTAGDVMAAETLMNMSSGISNAMMDMANSAGNFNDSINRATLEAEGFGVSADQMKSVVSDLSDTTGRAGGQIREAFIKATARGVTDMGSFKTMMEGAGAQAYLLGTDIETMGNKFSGMAQKDTLMTRALAETGITMDELGVAMGMTGATADEVKEKWKELDTNQRAAILGTAASMNEGKNANAEYKTSWAGLQEQVEIARGRIERLAGEVLLPVLVPALQVASGALQGLGDIISGVMSSPLGGLVSALGALGGAFIIAVTGVGALKNILGFLRIEATLTAIETTALAMAEEIQGGASLASAAANVIGASGFAGLATAAWGAATAVWAVIAPLLPFIAIGAAIVLVIYEIGKAFGWWTDAGSMIDAIGAGLQRLWDAFINHPDVQALITAISSAFETLSSWIGQAWNAILEFFGVANGGQFDLVRAVIDAVGLAWQSMTAPIRLVISLVQWAIGIFNQFATGQLTLQGVLTTIWNTITTTLSGIFTRIITGVLRFGVQMLTNAIRAGRNFVNGIVNNLRVLPGRVFSLLHSVVSRITGAIGAWIGAAKDKVHSVIHAITSPFSGVASAISGALSGVVSAITAPFQSAWEAIKPIVDKIKSAMDIIPSFGGEPAYGGETLPVVPNSASSYTVNVDDSPLVIEDNINLNLDLSNVPSHINTNQLIEALTDKNVLSALTGNRDFQTLDARVKQRLNLKANRSRGV